jgi:hypothetical protein
MLPEIRTVDNPFALNTHLPYEWVENISATMMYLPHGYILHVYHAATTTVDADWAFEVHNYERNVKVKSGTAATKYGAMQLAGLAFVCHLSEQITQFTQHTEGIGRIN